MTLWLSAIVPVHDGAPFLEATLAAAAAERPDGVEFLIYDSSDDGGACRAIAESFADRLTIRYAATPDCKPWTAKTNRGAREARAPHIAMLHQDDLWLPGHLAALQASLAQAPDAAMSIAPSRFIDARGRHLGHWHLPFRPGLHEGAELAGTLIVQNTIAIPSPVIRRDAWEAAGGMDESLWYTADWDLYLKLARRGPIHIRLEPTTAFRIHGSSLTMTGSRSPDDFAGQIEAVLARHLPSLPADVRGRQEPLARAAAALNCAMALPRGSALATAAGSLARLGPVRLARLLSATRLIDRVVPRLRLRLAGAL